jgi:hypothetical protein
MMKKMPLSSTTMVLACAVLVMESAGAMGGDQWELAATERATSSSSKARARWSAAAS